MLRNGIPSSVSEHGLHREVPGTGSVGGGHNHGDAAHHEGHEGTVHTQVGGLLKAEEGEVEMQEVAAPDEQRVGDVEPRMLYLAYRHHTGPKTVQRVFHLIINGHLAQQESHKCHGGHQTDGGDQIAGGGELGEEGVDAGARLGEEVGEDGELQQDGGERDGGHHHGIDGALGHHGAQRLWEGHSVVALQHAAAQKLAHAGYHQTGGIGEEDGVHRRVLARMLTDGLQRLAPAQAAEQLRRHAEGQGEQHPRPVHIILHGIAHLVEVESAVHPIQNGSSQHEGEDNLKNVVARSS